MTDARFEDVGYADQPIRLRAESAEDLVVISSLVQDAVCKSGDIHWLPKSRRLVLILRRFRWEDSVAAQSQKRPFERVQTALTVESALALQVRGIAQADKASVLSVLTLAFTTETDGTSALAITLADGAEIRIGAECLDVTLTDLTRPWEAQSDKEPAHPD